MKIYYSHYKFEPEHKRSALDKNKASEGWLLKLQSGDEEGFANLHAHGFDDFNLDEVKALLLKKEIHPALGLAINYAEQDLQSRRLKYDSLASAFLIENHYSGGPLLNFDVSRLPQLYTSGFRIIKIKLGLDREREEKLLTEMAKEPVLQKLKLRLDFNSSYTAEDFTAWLESHKLLLERVDFIEDPTEYDSAKWSAWRKKFKVNLALDLWNQSLRSEWSGASHLIFKPARMNAIEFLKQLKDVKDYKFVVTHFLDHSVGVATAAATALKMKFFIKDKLIECGLIPTHEKDSWVESKGPHLVMQTHFGIGFNEELAKIKWSTLYEY